MSVLVVKASAQDASSINHNNTPLAGPLANSQNAAVALKAGEIVFITTSGEMIVAEKAVVTKQNMMVLLEMVRFPIKTELIVIPIYRMAYYYTYGG